MRALFATDLSEASLAALDCLCKCQRDDFEEIVLLHVVDVDMYTEGGSLPLFLETDRKLLDESAGRLRELGLAVRTRVEQGRVVHEIRRVAQEEGAGLVVVGNLGGGGVAGRMLGGTAEAVASSAQIPVLIEKVSRETGSWCRTIGGHAFRRTLVGVDFSDGSRRALDAVVRLPGLEAVRLVHVTGHDEDVGLGSLEDRANRLETWAAGSSERTPVDFELQDGDPVERLAASAEDWGATCIATGLCGHAPLHRLRWGSVSSGIARRTALPVLLVPSAPRQ